MSLVSTLSCPCRANFIYKSKAGYNAHFKSKKHIAWDATSKETKAYHTSRDNHIRMLEHNLQFAKNDMERLAVDKAKLEETIKKRTDLDETITKEIYDECEKAIRKLTKECKCLKKTVEKYKSVSLRLTADLNKSIVANRKLQQALDEASFHDASDSSSSSSD